MNVRIIANSTSTERPDFGPTIRLQPLAIATRALCLGIVVLNLVGAIMGLSGFAIWLWNHHPILAICSLPAAILLFAVLIECGIAHLRADAA